MGSDYPFGILDLGFLITPLVPRLTVSDYPFGIIKLSLLFHIRPVSIFTIVLKWMFKTQSILL
jgi:hypothetical protein